MVHADDDSRGEESQVNQQDDKRGESRVRNESGDQFRRFSPYRPPRSELHFTVRTHPVVCADEGPAVGAHAAFIHALILQAGLFAPPLIKSRLPFCARYVVRDKDPRQQIVEIGRLAYQKGWVAANDGNISVRLAADRILATPTGVSKGMMEPEDLIICDLDGKKIEGERDCTSEIMMHTTIYRMRPDVKAVVHAHPPVATGFAVAGRPLIWRFCPK